MTHDPTLPKRADLREFGFHPLSLRLWHGMALDAWLRMMWGNWHLVSVRRYPLAVTITIFSVFNLFLKWVSVLVYGRRLRAVVIEPDPIFIVGHWRSGTTWLHHLFMMDPRFAAPTRAACFCPEFFLVVQKTIKPLLQALLPNKRPMDNVDLDLDKAEEDEIGICLSGAASSYRTLLFPSESPVLLFSPEDMGSHEAAIWRKKWLDFLRRVQFVNPEKRLVLKSPTHSLRIPEILRLFPNAKFIHIRRDPRKIFLSERHTNQAMETVCALQDRLPVRVEWAENKVADMVAFHEKLEADRGLVPAENWTSLRYEDLRSATIPSLRGVYDALKLGGFDAVQSKIGTPLETPKPYKPNTYDLDEDTRVLLDREFAHLFDLYGYAPVPSQPVVAK
ncbi:MAG: sulfotransferase family protein [Marivita sp.]|uniref:sulfotransferase family protein n=1 Tax=Marivita sp. TaxID=2003365 RepID=UPI003EF92F63